ncbi:hypothetical protein TNCV_3710402 [Trichonephila clavipes]|nr:hypothetical protein TNCV_3710402 [Trichonephila clavipes]
MDIVTGISIADTMIRETPRNFKQVLQPKSRWCRPCIHANGSNFKHLLGCFKARRLPEVHPEYSAIASMIQRVNPPSLSAALTLQQCLSGDTEEKYHQTIDRLIPTSRLQRSVGQRKRKSNPGTLFSFLGDSAHGKHAV